MPLGLRAGVERAEVSRPARLGVLLARNETILARFQLPDHGRSKRCRPGTSCKRDARQGGWLLSREQVPHVPHRHREATLSQVVDDALLVLPCPAIPIRIPAGATNLELVARDEALRRVALTREAKLGRHEGAPAGTWLAGPRSLKPIPGGLRA